MRYIPISAAVNHRSGGLDQCRSGFTLIELLVVVTIISILATMLMPMIKVVREQAESTRCSNCMRQLGLAAEAYAYDNDGMKVATSLLAPPSSPSWPLLLISYFGTRENMNDSMATGVYNGCPTWHRDPLWKKIAAERGIGWISTFGMGFAINSQPGQPTTGNRDDWSNPYLGAAYKVNFPLATISSPTNRIFFAEMVKRSSDLTDVWTSAEDFFAGYGPDSPAPGAASNWANWRMGQDAFRHRGGANYIFFDGHVERVHYPLSAAEGNTKGGPGLGQLTPAAAAWVGR